ncbi:hypothetical protein KAR91_52200 [Candidatus Pacearchaeota archaeon]|nr:hypothetical protein [Candidatus Pacearchaeota archaeon]
MKEITIPIKETEGFDLNVNPIKVTDGEGKQIGSIFIGLGSGKIFITNYKKTYTINPEDLWGAVFPDFEIPPKKS